MNKDIEALDQLIDEAMNQEKALAAQAEELSLWKRIYLWVWARCHRKHISIWVLNDDE